MLSTEKGNKRKIGLFVGKLAGGGAERVVSRLSLCLSDYYDIYILLYNTKTIDYDYNGTIIDLAQNASCFPLMAVRAVKNINRVIKEHGIELVISLCDFPNTVNGLFNHSSIHVFSIRAHFQKNVFYTFADRLKRPILRKAVLKSDYIWALTKQQKETLIKDLGIRAERIFVLPNLFDIKSIQTKAEGNIEPSVLSFINPYTTIAVGRLENQKNYSELLEIFFLVNKDFPLARLIVLGSGKLKRKLLYQTKKLGIEKKVLFLERVQNPFAYMKKCRIYISMTRYEGFPNSLVEAMALGLPVIHSDCPTGARDILKDNSGILTPIPRCSSTVRHEIASDWIRLLSDSTYASNLGNRALKRSLTYDAANITNMFIETIDTIISSS